MIDIDKIFLVLSVGMLLANLFVLFVIIFYLLSKISKQISKSWKIFDKLMVQKAIFFSFIIATGSTLGSLYHSEIVQLPPCDLCWLQRVFMYPLSIILLVALVRKSKDVFYYVLPLSAVGGAVALYHYFLQFSPNPEAPCSAVGLSVSCTQRYITHFGYITIPFMALTSFALIIIFMLFLMLFLRKSVVK